MLRNMTDTRLHLFIALALIVITAAVYMPVFRNEFVNYDDDRYVYNNARVQDGVSIGSIAWAFRSTDNANWHPLTWISHMVDCHIYKLKPWGHHLTNLLLHLANTVLLFLILARLTGYTWRSAFVAALFAVHPLHVESVAWAAERKDVLSTLFWMLTMLAYVRYAASPSIKRYLLVAGAFVLGLMSKPMLVSLPIVLLMLDYWPLGRFARTARAGKKQHGRSPAVGLVMEKMPLFALSVGSCIITMIAQRTGGAMNSLEGLPFAARLSTSVAGYAAYIMQMLWPVKLGVIYPHPADSLPAWQIGGSALLIVAVSFLAYRMRNSRPHLAFGWLWFVITLAPVIGLIQVGSQFIADRYTYVPLIGLFVAIAWGVPEMCGRMGVWGYGSRSKNASTSTSKSKNTRTSDTPTLPHTHTPLLALPAAVVILLLCVGTYRQVGFWKDGYTLFSHALEVTSPSAVAHTNLGIALAARDRLDEAIENYQKALELSPGHINAMFNMGNAYVRKGMYEEAIEQYQQAAEQYEGMIATRSGSVEAHTNLANAYSEMRRYEQAESEFQEALDRDPAHLPALTNYGNLLKDTGRFEEAEGIYRRILAIRPNDPESHSSLGVALAGQALLDEAVEEFNRALELDPKHPGTHVNLANVYASRKEFDKAAEEYRLAIGLDGDLLEAHHNLGLVLRMQGDMAAAITEFRKAIKIKPSMPMPHVSLATALYGVGDYAGAWREIHLCEANRGRPPKQFVDTLSAKMPDPGQ